MPKLQAIPKLKIFTVKLFETFMLLLLATNVNELLLCNNKILVSV